MSGTAPSQRLQRFLVRMLYDPTLVASVYAGAVPEGLTGQEAGWLRATPRAAWATDPYRQSRTLQALLEEFPASVALLGVAQARGFFAAPRFHQAIMQREALALAFGAWLEPQVGAVASLEQGIARLRRRRPIPIGEVEGLICAPGVLPLRLPKGTLGIYQQIRAALGPSPVEGLAALQGPLLPGRAAGGEEEWWLLERSEAGEVQVGGGSAGLNELLEIVVEAPLPREALVEAVQALGAGDEAEAAEVIDDLVADGLLVRAGGAAG